MYILRGRIEGRRKMSNCHLGYYCGVNNCINVSTRDIQILRAQKSPIIECYLDFNYFHIILGTQRGLNKGELHEVKGLNQEWSFESHICFNI